MEVKKLTCVECPIGCSIEVTVDGGVAVKVEGNGCPRGKLYAENEVVCPKRVVTTTVRAQDGQVIPVKTDRPVKKTEIFAVMKKINDTVCTLPIRTGDVIIENVDGEANVVATACSR